MSILDYFHGEPRPQQSEVLRKLESLWNRYDVFILRMPVGAGKSRVAKCLLNWQGRGTVVTPTNVLKNQYLDEMPDLASHASLPECSNDRAEYEAGLDEVSAAPQRCTTYYGYLGQRHRYYQPLLVVDEAHQLIPFLQDKEAVKLWYSKFPIPHTVRTVADLVSWAEAHSHVHATVRKLAKKLAQHPDTFVLEHAQEFLRGRQEELIRLLPITPRNNRPILWPPSKVRKLVFMSASFHEEDLYDLGLDGRRVCTLDSSSPIPATNRPIVYDPVGSLGAANVDATLPLLVERLKAYLVAHPNERGFVHTTYSLARRLREHLRDPRLVWHGRDNRGLMYHRWLNDEQPNTVFVGCGFTEGIDLKYDRARWQVVTKLMYPSKGESAVLKKLQQRPAWYSWVAARDLQQAAGRVSRAPDDFGVTYLVDKDFQRLYSQNSGMFTPSFHEALVCI